MLRIHVMHQPRKWEEYLPLVEFTYNNGCQESLKMSPFEVIYGQNFNTPINQNDLVNRVLIRPDMLKDMDQEMQTVRRNLKVEWDNKKSYAN